MYHLQLPALKLRTNRDCQVRTTAKHFLLGKNGNNSAGFVFSFWVCVIWCESGEWSTTRIYPFPILTWEDNWILKLVKWTLRRHQQIRDPQHQKLCRMENVCIFSSIYLCSCFRGFLADKCTYFVYSSKNLSSFI